MGGTGTVLLIVRQLKLKAGFKMEDIGDKIVAILCVILLVMLACAFVAWLVWLILTQIEAHEMIKVYLQNFSS